MSTLQIGDEVVLPQGQRAILKWIGQIPGRQPTEYAGVEVIGPDAESHGKHSGTYQGQQIFTTSRPHTGLFVSYVQLLSRNITGPAARPGMKSMGSASASPMSFSGPFSGASSIVSSALSSRQSLVSNPDYGSVKPAISNERQFFRESLAAVQAKMEDQAKYYEQQLEQLRKDCEDQLKRARRSSTIYTSGSEVDEQRAALAAMQNTLIKERTEKQEEINKLQTELSSMRKLAGGVNELESLVTELESNERELAQLRAQAIDANKLKQQLAESLEASKKLEIALKSREASQGSPEVNTNTVTREKYEQLEQFLENELLRRSETDGENEALRQKVAELEKEITGLRQSSANQTQNLSASSDKSLKNKSDRDEGAKDPLRMESLANVTTDILGDITLNRDVSMIDAVPVPDKLAAFDDSIDIAAGRSDWCSLCERQGHVTTECPF